MTQPAALKGRARLSLIRDLAMGVWTDEDLAEQLGTTPTDIKIFSDRYAFEISETRGALAGRLAIETSGLWISDKAQRLAEMQGLYEDNEEVIAEMRKPTAPPGNDLGSKRHYNLSRLQLQILSRAADEVESRAYLLAARATDDEANATHYIIEAGPHADNLT